MTALCRFLEDTQYESSMEQLADVMRLFVDEVQRLQSPTSPSTATSQAGSGSQSGGAVPVTPDTRVPVRVRSSGGERVGSVGGGRHRVGRRR